MANKVENSSKPALGHGASEGTHRPGPTRATGQWGGDRVVGYDGRFGIAVPRGVVEIDLASLLDRSRCGEGTEDRHD